MLDSEKAETTQTQEKPGADEVVVDEKKKLTVDQVVKAEGHLQGSANLEEVLKDNKPNLFGTGMLRLYGICFLVYFCSTMNGFDGSLMSSINTLQVYLDYYNQDGADAGTGLVFSIFNIGQIAAAPVTSILMDFLGRRSGIAIGCLGVVVGTCVAATAKNISVFIGGRFLLSFFATIASTAAPMYCVEMAPPHIRGAVSGTYNTLYYLGSMLAAFSIYGCMTSFPEEVKAFRIPLWVQMACPGIVLVACTFIPESPRHLVSAGKEEKARKLITTYHCNGDADHPLVDLEISEMILSLQNTKLSSPKTFLDIRELFMTHGQRYRTMLIVVFSWFSQFSGNNVISYFMPMMLKKIGITEPADQVLQNAYYAIDGLGFAIIGSFCHDWVGRRTMFMFSTLSMSVCLAVVAATTAEYQKGNHSEALANTTLAFIYIFGSVFAMAFTSMQPIYPGELASNQLRGKSMMLMSLVGGAASFVNQFAAPVAMENISYWFYVFFVFFDLFEFGFVYFFFVETRGRTLEELEEIFRSPHPKKASLQPFSKGLTV